jgi:uncharacterized UPF0146 family protein
VGTRTTVRNALADRLDAYDALLEVGVGSRYDVATELEARGHSVTVTDVTPREDATELPPAVTFVRDDVTSPTTALYRDADAVYALNCPPELQRPLVDVAARANAACLITTLGTDPVVVPATAEQLPDARVTVHVARE